MSRGKHWKNLVESKRTKRIVKLRSGDQRGLTIVFTKRELAEELAHSVLNERRDSWKVEPNQAERFTVYG